MNTEFIRDALIGIAGLIAIGVLMAVALFGR